MKSTKKNHKKPGLKKNFSVILTNPEIKFLFIATFFHVISQIILYACLESYNLYTMLAVSLIPTALLCLSFRFRPLRFLRYPSWVFISYYFSQFIVILINTLFRNFISNNIYISLISAISFLLFLFITIFAPCKILKKPLINREKLGLKGLPTWTDIALAIIGFAAYVLLSAILIKIFELFPFFDATQKQDTIYVPSLLLTTFDRLIALIAIAVIPPIIEEIIFRGWLYQKLRRNINKFSVFFSILIVSAFFGLMHGQWNVGVGVFAMSVISCLIRELTGTIYGSILLHMIANFVAFYFVFILQT